MLNKEKSKGKVTAMRVAKWDFGVGGELESHPPRLSIFDEVP